LTVLIFTAAVWVRSTENTSIASTSQAQQSQQPPQTVASSVERQLNTIEKLVMEAADAMPEDKFNFSPESLNIPGADYKGVRTFAGQVSMLLPPIILFGRRLLAINCPRGSKTETALRI
jgi:hypothetical protein